jgi:CRISPR-associated protein Csy2
MEGHLMKKYIVIEKIDVQNANAWNNIVVGFPAITGFLGATHALERMINDTGIKCCVSGTGIILHEYELKSVTIPKKGWDDTLLTIPRRSLILGKNDTIKEQHFTNQAYIDIIISLVIEINIDESVSLGQLCKLIKHKFNKLRIAGGMVCGFNDVKIVQNVENLPHGYVLMDRSYMMRETDGNDMLEKMFNVIHENNDFIAISVGYKSLSDLGHVKGQRDPSKLHCFVESIFGIGEFYPIRAITDFSQIMWSYSYQNGIYRCTQKNKVL